MEIERDNMDFIPHLYRNLKGSQDIDLIVNRELERMGICGVKPRPEIYILGSKELEITGSLEDHHVSEVFQNYPYPHVSICAEKGIITGVRLNNNLPLRVIQSTNISSLVRYQGNSDDKTNVVFPFLTLKLSPNMPIEVDPKSFEVMYEIIYG